MSYLYFDGRFAFSVADGSGKFNGGSNYAKNILNRLLENELNDIQVIVLCDAGAEPAVSKEFSLSKDCIWTTRTIYDFRPVGNEGVYFNPRTPDTVEYTKELEWIKRNFQGIKIYLTIHDRRHKENWFDKYDGLLKTGIKSNWVFLGLGRMVNSIRKDAHVKKNIGIADKIFTVSNYSMQCLINLQCPRNISYYTQGVICLDSKGEDKIGGDDYVLFVSAGRPEKNFIRSLIAFERYVAATKDKNTKMVATGISKEQQEAIKSRKIVGESFLESRVLFKEYVESDELGVLYANCRFLLFTSKSEGYGLPVAEALFYGKPAVVSYISSIPEILGGLGVYVNPFSIDSIELGIERMMNDKFYQRLIQFIPDKRKIWENSVQLDEKLLINDLISFNRR